MYSDMVADPGGWNQGVCLSPPVLLNMSCHNKDGRQKWPFVSWLPYPVSGPATEICAQDSH